MEPDRFSTEGLRIQDQFDAWREWFGSAFDVCFAGHDESAFNAEYMAWPVGNLIVTSLSAPAVRAVRSPTHLRRSPVDHWVITYSREGATHVATNQGEFQASGAPFLWSLGQSAQHISMTQKAAGKRLQLVLPRDSFPDMAMQLDLAVNKMLDTPMGLMLGEFLISLEKWLPAIAADELPVIEGALRVLVAGIKNPSAEWLCEAHPQIALPQLDKVRRVVQANLGSPSLTVDELCRRVGMSRATLYRLLEPQGGVVRFIRRARLVAARDMLGDPGGRASISSVAEDFCFSSPQAFSRAFRAEFDCSPTDVRDKGLVVSAERPARPAGRWEDILARR